MTNKDKKLLRFMKSPAKVLTKARDLYVHSLIGCAGQVSYGTVMGCPTGQFSALSRTRSLGPSGSSAQCYSKEPMRSVSFMGLPRNYDHVETKPSCQHQHQHQQQQQQEQQMGSSTEMANAVISRNQMPRSFSLGVIGRIDEDKPYSEFEEDDELPVAAEVLLRSSSCCFKMNWM